MISESKKQVCTYISKELIDKMLETGREEKLTMSKTIETLIKEGLEYRKQLAAVTTE